MILSKQTIATIAVCIPIIALLILNLPDMREQIEAMVWVGGWSP